MEIVGTFIAKQIDSQMLKIEIPVSFKRKFACSSEFRCFSRSELEEVIENIRAG